MAKKKKYYQPDYKALLGALSSLNDFMPSVDLTQNTSPVATSAQDFGSYFLEKAWGVPTSTPPTEDGKDGGWKSALLDTFKWMGSLGTGVQNVIQDTVEEAREIGPQGGFEPGNLGGTVLDLANTLRGSLAKNTGKAAGVFVGEPLQELLNVPGINIPGEDFIENKFMTPLKDSLFYRPLRDQEGNVEQNAPVHGSRLLEDWGVDSEVNRGVGGFAIDVATDPLTYVGGAGLGKAALQKGLGGFAKATKPVDQKLSELAAGLPSESIKPLEMPRGPINLPPVNPQVLPPARETLPLGTLPSQPGFLGSAAVKQADPLFPTQGLTSPPVAGSVPVEGALRGYEPDFTPPVNPVHNLRRESSEVVTPQGINPFVVSRAVAEDTLSRAKNKVNFNPVAGASGVGLANAKTYAQLFYKNKLQEGMKELNAVNQRALYNQIYKATERHPQLAKVAGNKEIWRRAETLRQLKSAEDELIKMGVGVSGIAGQGLRLSEVLGAVGPDKVMDVLNAFGKGVENASDEVKGIVAQVSAARAAQAGYVTKQIFDEVEPALSQAIHNNSHIKFSQTLDDVAKYMQKRGLTQGLTEKEAIAARDAIKSWTGVDEVGSWELHKVVALATPKIAKLAADKQLGKTLTRSQQAAEKQAIHLIRKAVSKEVDHLAGKNTPVAIAERVRVFVATNFTTWMGRGAEWETLRSAMSPVQAHAKARAEWFSNIAKNHTPAESVNAYRLAQQLSGGADISLLGTAKERELAEKYLDYFEEIWGSTRNLWDPKLGKFKDVTDIQGTVAFRSGLVMTDINTQLKAMGSKFRFKESKDYKDWRLSWQHVDPQKDFGVNPYLFMYNLDVALHKVLAEYNVIDSFVEQYGRKIGDAGFDPKVHTKTFPYGTRVPDDVKFPREAIEPFAKLLEDYHKGPWIPESKVVRMLMTAQRHWKSAVTIYYPSHHIRNGIGDSWLMWMSGINDPRVFSKSMKVLRTQKERYSKVINESENIGDVTKFLEGGFRQTDNRAIVTNKFKAGISADEYYGEALKRGLLLDASRIEDLYGADMMGIFKGVETNRLAQPLNGKGHAVASAVAETREHYFRIAHVIGYVEKHLPADVGRKLAKTNDPEMRSQLLKPILDKAADEVRKWHPDGTDMTRFEQMVRGPIPFYAWSRKALPLTIEAMFMSPGKIQAYPRGMAALQESLGIETEGGPWNPFPNDQLFPDWMTNGAIGPIGDPESENAFARWFGKLGRNAINPFGQEEGYTIVDPGRTAIPFNSFVSDFGRDEAGVGDILKGGSEQLSPGIQIPADVLRDSTSTGAPISKDEGGEGYGSYALSQIPQAAPFQRLFGIGKDYQENMEQGPMNTEALVNLMTAAGVSGSGKYIKSAEFQERERQSKESKKRKEELEKAMKEWGLK